MSKALSLMKAHWPAIVAFLMAFWEKFGTQIDAYVKVHPHLSVYFALAAFTVTYYLRSPFGQKALPEQGMRTFSE